MSQKLKVLVTGGAGYIGSHAVLALKDAGHSPVVIDNLVTGFRWAIPDDVPFVEGNIADEALVAGTLRDNGIDAIMHFAGSIIVPESVENPLKYYRNNTANSRTLIDCAVRGGVKHFIFSSTAATYGIPESSPVREDAPKLPINPYGMSKLMTEYMLRDVAAAHDFNYCALRYFNVAGADPQARTGQSTAGATHLIKVAVEAALGKRDKVEVFDQPGHGGIVPVSLDRLQFAEQPVVFVEDPLLDLAAFLAVAVDLTAGEDALVNGLADVELAADAVGDGILREIGVHRGRADADQHREVMHVQRLAGAHDQRLPERRETAPR